MSENERRILQRDPHPHLFRPIAFRSVEARNRIMLSPMCQYSATDGLADDWHLVHLGARAVGGAGIVCTESVHIEERGRITHHCLGLWNDAQRDALARIARFVTAQGAVPAIQLGHAGRKASVTRPWEGTKPLEGEAAWETISASAEAFGRFPPPRAMERTDIDTVIRAAGDATRRAREAGFRIVEVHAAHGYLIHQFLSPLSNKRTDGYGGSFPARIRFLMETLDAMRGEWPADLPMFVRLSCTDWVEGGWDLEQTVALVQMLKARGDVDLIDCTTGGNDPRQQIPIHPGYQIPFSEQVRARAGLPTAAVGLMHSPDMAEEVIANGRADLVCMGRAILAEPHWPLYAAKTLHARDVEWPLQYERSNIY